MRAQRPGLGQSRASRSSDCTLRAHVKENRRLQVAQFLRLLTGGTTPPQPNATRLGLFSVSVPAAGRDRVAMVHTRGPAISELS